MNIGEEIKVRRLKKGWTLSKLSEESGVIRESIWCYENEKYYPGWRTAELIIDALGYEFVIREKP